ncbi:MAG: hypothetical protein NVSMB47_07020 [Polyangiales bacterium]
MSSRIAKLLSLLPLTAAAACSMVACSMAQGGGEPSSTSTDGRSIPKSNPPSPGSEVRDRQPDARPTQFLNRSEDLFKGLTRADFGKTYSGTPGGAPPAEVSLQAWDTPVKNQGARGWCTAFATVGAIENLVKHGFGVETNLSEIDHWMHYQQYSIYASVKAAFETPITPEESYPYWGDPIPGYESTAVAKIEHYKTLDTKDQMIGAIAAGHPVVIGIDLTDSWNYPTADGGVSSSGGIIGGHALVVTGYKNDAAWGGGGYMLIKNSWGTRWGDLGYARVPYSYCETIGCYFIEIEEVRYKGATPTPSPTPSPDPNPTPTPPPKPAAEPTADDIDVVAEHDPSSPDRFTTHLVARTPEQLAQVRDVTYDTHETFGDYEFWTVSDAADGFAIPFYYRTYAHHWRTNGAVVHLLSGTTLRLAGAVIDW